MTLKYESEILFDLMKRDGVSSPSDVLPYESELKEKYLEQVKGAYPKLQDYRSEWLNYNLNAYVPADFPIETLSNVTEATVDNVVPYAYKSAILNGQTLMNHFPPFNPTCWEARNGSVMYDGYVILKASNAADFRPKSGYRNYPTLKPSTQYTYIYYVSENVGNVSIAADNGFPFSGGHTGLGVGLHKSLVITPEEIQGNYLSQWFVIGANDKENGYAKITMMMLIEGDWTNTELPFKEHFDGMQSVKMPTLTTNGKNLLDSSFTISKGKELHSDGTIVSSGGWAVEDFMPVTFRGDCVFSSVATWLNIAFYTEDKTFISIKNAGNNNKMAFTVPENAKYFRVSSGSGGVSIASDLHYQIEQGAVSTTYEPFKSNILTVNEDVTLRGIGDVQDTLDLMTGEVKKNVSDLETLEDISKYTQSGNTTTDNLVITYSMGGTSKSGDRKFISTHEIAKYGRLVEWYGRLSFRFALPRSDSRFSDLNTFKSYIKDNPFEYIRVLEEEEKSIKTVDLTVTDQDGNTVSIIRPIEGTMHLMTEGDTIKPLFSGEIPVEPITQNLASFIEE